MKKVISYGYFQQRMNLDKRTELLLDDLKNLLVVELLRQTLNSGQGFTSISLCGGKGRSARWSRCAMDVGGADGVELNT